MKWALASLPTKLVEVMEFQLNSLKSSKMMLLKCSTQYRSVAHLENSAVALELENVSFHFNPKESAKECSNGCTVALISHASKVMLKILQARLRQEVSQELPDVQAGFRKGRGTRDQVGKICWIIEKAYSKAFNCADHNKLENCSRDGIPHHLTRLLRLLHVGQEATVRTGHGTTSGSKLKKNNHN